MSELESGRYQSFKEFYPFYLSQHRNLTCRNLHYVGSILVLGLLISSFYFEYYPLLILMPIVGYGFAWVGHFFFENNRPATFQYPIYSFLADWVMLAQRVARFFR